MISKHNHKVRNAFKKAVKLMNTPINHLPLTDQFRIERIRSRSVFSVHSEHDRDAVWLHAHLLRINLDEVK